MVHCHSSLLLEALRPKILGVPVDQRSLLERRMNRNRDQHHHPVAVLAQLKRDCFLEERWVAAVLS
jgi:hypothetical protein